VIDVAALEALDGDIDAYGDALAGMLFGAEAKVKSFYDKARAVANEKDMPVHFRIYVDPKAPAEYRSVRWETLRDPEDGLPVATKRNLMLSRHLKNADWRQAAPPKKHDLHALVAIANPSDGERLGYRLPAIAVERARDALGAIRTTPLASGGRATLGRIADALDECIDILYLVCHGVIRRGEPLLFLEEPDGRTALTGAAQLAQRIAELQRRPTLAVLSSCASAGPGAREESVDDGALAPLGPSLVDAGVPAVVAMQGNVTVETAGRFMKTFFTALDRDGIVDRAVAVARGEVRDRPDWWVPVLYSRLKRGRTYYVPGFADRESNTWRALLESVEQKECTPVVGPGLAAPIVGSREHVARSWVERWEMPITEENRADLTTVAQYLRVRSGRGAAARSLRSHLLTTLRKRYKEHLTPEQLDSMSPDELIAARGAQVMDENPDEPHMVLARLRLPIYITTSWTGLLADAIERTGADPTVRVFDWSSRRDGPSEQEFLDPTPEQPLVYHLFGRLDRPDSIVLSEDDYFAWLMAWIAKRAIIPTCVQPALTSTSLLFLGHRLSDWDFRVLFQSIKSFAGAGRLRDNVHVGVQLSPDSQAIDPEAAQDYLESALGEENVNIYWEQTEVFLGELVRRRNGS
jgi:hypothetical protein